MKKHILALTAYALFILLLLGTSYTFPYFNDIETSTNNTIITAESWNGDYLADHLIISEIQITDSSSVYHDYVELYNPTDTDIDLNNYAGSYIRLVKRTATGTTDTTLKSWSLDGPTIVPAYGYYLWACNQADDGWENSIGADASTQEYLADNNAVALRIGDENTGIIVDAVGWGSATNTLVETQAYPTNPTNGQSLERKAHETATSTSMAPGGIDENNGNGYDTNNNHNDFVLQTTPNPQNTGSPREPPV